MKKVLTTTIIALFIFAAVQISVGELNGSEARLYDFNQFKSDEIFCNSKSFFN